MTFFNALDGRLASEETIFLIGGGAVLITKHTERMTKDLDTWMSVPEKILEIWNDVVKETGIELIIGAVSIAQAPYNMEDRVIEAIRLKYLKVVTPAPIDLIMMKIPRSSDTDKVDIEALIQGLNAEELLEVFKGEFLPNYIGGTPPTLNYLVMIETYFGEDVAESHAEILGYVTPQ